jgi:hypothetical protein
MHKIKRISYFFRLFFLAAFIMLPLILAMFWINAPNPVGFPKAGFPVSFTDGVEILHTLSNTTKFYGFLICLIPIGFMEYVFYCLVKLFSLYEKAEIFSIKSVNYIKKIGQALLLSQLLNPFYDALKTLNLSWGNPHGHRFISISIDGTNIGIILMALMTILISWIMAEGCRLREEQQLTI